MKPRPFYQYDLLVVIAALALVATGGLAYRSLTAPSMHAYEKEGLGFTWPGQWLPSEPVAMAPPRLLGGVDAQAPGKTRAPIFHEIYSYARDPELRLEVRIDYRAGYGNLRGVLSFERRNRYGEMYRQIDGRAMNIGGHDWLRTRYQYAYKPEKTHSPRTAVAVEYATLGGNRLYVVTIHGSPRATQWLSGIVGPTLIVPPETRAAPMSPLVVGEPRIHREVVRQTLPSVVLVMAVDLHGKRLAPVAGGSGTVVAADGSILTNFHVIYDEERDRLHDLFVIGRFHGEGREPEYVCAGRPNRSKIMAERDLALIQCDLDMDGQPWTPHDWPAVPIDLSENAARGEQIWVIGYPDVGGGAAAVSTGEVTGTVRDDIDGQTSFLVTTASISAGSSGGAAIDEQGFLVGVPTAFRARARVDGKDVTRLDDEGLVRPLARAAPLIAVAQAGWTPTLGDNQVGGPVEPTESDAELGVEISSVVRDAANDNPVAGAVVIAFRPGVTASDVDMNRLHEQALTWGRTDDNGRFTLQHRVPRGVTYTVAVLAKGYQPLIETGVLSLGQDAPSAYDPWGQIHVER